MNENLGRQHCEDEISLSTKSQCSMSTRQYDSRITGSENCDNPEITIEFHSFLLPHLPPPTPPPRNTFFLILSLSLSPSDGSITGAMLRELLQPSLSGCVSSNVRVELSNLLTMQEKGKKENEEKKSLWSPNDARWEPSCAKFRRVFLPSFLSCGPRTPIYRHSHIGPLCMAEPKQLCSAEKKWQQQNKEINKQINKHIREAYFFANARIRTFLCAICRKWTVELDLECT